MKQKIISSIKMLVFLSIGVFLLWLALRGQDFGQLWQEITHFNYWWIALSLLLNFLSHFSRAIRWNMLIEPLGYKPRTINTTLAVLVGYLANYAIPRMGEVSRCAILSRYEKQQFTPLFGTVFTERVIDTLALLIITAGTVLFQFKDIVHFFENNPESFKSLNRLLHSTPMLLGLLVVVLLLVGLVYKFWDKIAQISIMKKVIDLAKGFVEGLKSVLKLKSKMAFLGHTLFIWAMYYISFYVCFFAYGPTSHLGASVALTAFIMATFGMVAPVQGGIGVWHSMVIATLSIYGVDKAFSAPWTIVVHGSMTLLLIVLGFIALILLPIVNKKAVVKE